MTPLYPDPPVDRAEADRDDILAGINEAGRADIAERAKTDPKVAARLRHQAAAERFAEQLDGIDRGGTRSDITDTLNTLTEED